MTDTKRLKALNECNTFLSNEYQKRPFANANILEAGGGSFSYFKYPSGSTLYTLDISFHQLQNNSIARYRIQSDLQAFSIDKTVFDIIVCFNVLEHLKQPEKALHSLVNSLNPGGFLVIGLPDRNSIKGIITRYTPVFMHRWYYKYIVGKKDRGGNHFDAFATVYHPFTKKSNLLSWVEKKNLIIEFCRFYNGAREYNITSGNLKAALFGIFMDIAGSIGTACTLGRWSPLNSDILMVIKKPF